jgi:hypothetical protein
MLLGGLLGGEYAAKEKPSEITARRHIYMFAAKLYFIGSSRHNI